MPEVHSLMASYSNSEMEMLLSTPVDRVLAFFGKNTAHRNYMYYSPFRDESEPSMRVTVDHSTGQWVWADFGGMPSPGKRVDGGGCLDMVMRLKLGHWSKKRGFGSEAPELGVKYNQKS